MLWNIKIINKIKFLLLLSLSKGAGHIERSLAPTISENFTKVAKYGYFVQSSYECDLICRVLLAKSLFKLHI